MVTRRESIKASWSQVENALQRRADLIPNLVATVKGYATHEEKAIADVANARAGLMNAKSPQEKIAANDQLSGTLGRPACDCRKLSEPEANENFIRLQDELSGTETGSPSSARNITIPCSPTTPISNCSKQHSGQHGRLPKGGGLL